MPCCCTLVAVLATTISSSCITNFMTLPPWMPTSVASSDTFGSSDHEYTRVTSNTLAAVESIFDAYYERVYYKSAGAVKDLEWSTLQYGSNDFKTMSFTNGVTYGLEVMNYRNGNRTCPDTFRFVEFDELFKFLRPENEAINNLIDNSGQIIFRNNWKKDDGITFWSSTLLGGRRIPLEYWWKYSDPTTEQVSGCLPIFACEPDEYFHTDETTRESQDNFIIPYMFSKCDGGYYGYHVEGKVPDQRISKTFSEILDEEFGGCSKLGITNETRRLAPDDYYNSETNMCSSLVATLSRTLSALDRTYEFPSFNEYANLTNVNVYAKESGVMRMRGYYDVDEIKAGDGYMYFELPNAFTDVDLEVYDWSSFTNKTMTYGITETSARDKGRFHGTQTTISQVSPTYDERVFLCKVSDLISSFTPYGSTHEGTNRVNLVGICEYGAGLFYHVRFNSVEDGTTIIDYAIDPATFGSFRVPAEYYVTVSKSARAEYTIAVNGQDVNRILPVTVPCGSSFDTGRALNPYASILLYGCRYVHELGSMPNGINEGVLYSPGKSGVELLSACTSMVGYQLLDVGSLRSSYYNARTRTRDRMISMIDEYASGWQNVEGLVHVYREMVDTASPMMYVWFIDGSVNAVPMVSGHIQDQSTAFFIEIRGIYARLGFLVENGIQWFDDQADVELIITFVPSDSGNGFKLRDDLVDLRAVSVDTLAYPLVTTDWNWKALKMTR